MAGKTNKNHFTIGTRGSKLALVQAEYVKSRLLDAHEGRELRIEIRVISTAGDRSQKANIALSEIGGKGLFTEEIEALLVSGEIDFAVHSAKDMPTVLPDGLELSCFPERESPADAFISRAFKSFEDLPTGATVGSASLRRKAIMLHHRPDLNVIMFRGNVDTRLRKIADGEADATLLAVAGLRRLGLEREAACPLSLETFLPAPGQGAICVETAIKNEAATELLQPINHLETSISLDAERAFLRELDGSCRTPIAGLATVDSGVVHLRGMVLSPDGKDCHKGEVSGPATEASELGKALGIEIRDRAGPDFFKGW